MRPCLPILSQAMKHSRMQNANVRAFECGVHSHYGVVLCFYVYHLTNNSVLPSLLYRLSIKYLIHDRIKEELSFLRWRIPLSYILSKHRHSIPSCSMHNNAPVIAELCYCILATCHLVTLISTNELIADTLHPICSSYIQFCSHSRTSCHLPPRAVAVETSG